MHINLILGAVFLAAVWWLLHEARKRKRDKIEPGEMLLDDMTRRREARERTRRAGERLAELKRERLAPVLAGLRDMAEALPAEDKAAGAMQVREENGGIDLTLSYDGKQETIFVEWDVQEFNLDIFSSDEALKVSGHYIARLPDGSLVRGTDLHEFMRSLSGLIADRLVRIG